MNCSKCGQKMIKHEFYDEDETGEIMPVTQWKCDGCGNATYEIEEADNDPETKIEIMILKIDPALPYSYSPLGNWILQPICPDCVRKMRKIYDYGDTENVD